MKAASIIIPTYNQSKFLAQAIDSALLQTYPNIEIIVVDDGSTDGTPAIISGFGQRVKYLYQENKGHSAARNAGYRISKGEYLLFLDSDDVLLPTALETCITFLETQRNFGLVYSAWQNFNENHTKALDEVRQNRQGHLLKNLLLRQFYFIPSATTIRREWLEKVGFFDESMICNADTDLWTRLAYIGCEFGYINSVLLKRRIHKQSVSVVQVNPECVKNRFSTLDKVFLTADLPKEIKAIQAQVYSILHYECAARYYHTNQIKHAQDHLRQAIKTCPSLATNQEWLLEWLAGFALGARVEKPELLLHQIFDNLPPEAETTLLPLRKRALGRYHAAAAFTAYHNHRPCEIRRHIVPALLNDIRLLTNRGFVKIALHSLYS